MNYEARAGELLAEWTDSDRHVLLAELLEERDKALTAMRVARIERDQARHRVERALAILTSICNLTNPPRLTHDGKVYEFNNPRANETLQALSDRIRAIPDEIAAAQLLTGAGGEAWRPLPVGGSRVTLCTECFPAWQEHEVLTIGRPMSPCVQCGRVDDWPSLTCKLFRRDPRAGAPTATLPPT